MERQVSYLTKEEQKFLNFYIEKGLSARSYTEATIYRKKAEYLIQKGRRRNKPFTKE